MAEKLQRQLETAVLPEFIVGQRWFAAKGERIDAVEFREHLLWPKDKGAWLLTRVKVHLHDNDEQDYFLPLAITWEKGAEDRAIPLASCTFAKVRQHAQVGRLCDALADPRFCESLAVAMGEHLELPFGRGTLRFSSTAVFADLAGGATLQELRAPAVAGTNTTVILGDRLFLKVYRHLEEGTSIELEMGRFLTEASPFAHVAPLAGALEYHEGDGKGYALALLQGYVSSQGDGWSYTLDYLERYLEEARLQPPDSAIAQAEELHGPYLMMIHTLGWRTGELHQALAIRTGDAAFEPERIRRQDLHAWATRVRKELAATLELLRSRRGTIPDHLRAEAEQLLAAKKRFSDRIASLMPRAVQAVKTRYHGDFHLGQVLLASNDFIIVDFEGEPARPFAERRAKHSPLRDVAGMLRSFNYAAHAVRKRITAVEPQQTELVARLLAVWERLAKNEFLASYRQAAQGCPSFPQSPEHSDALITLFTIEKALYELRYELVNRPEWVDIPLRGLCGFLVADGGLIS
jgi:maltose alpha-D-glucosyltransferase/alpha-amylase